MVVGEAAASIGAVKFRRERGEDCIQCVKELLLRNAQASDESSREAFEDYFMQANTGEQYNR